MFVSKLALFAIMLVSLEAAAPLLHASVKSPRSGGTMRFYVVDTHKGTAKGSLLIYDAASGKLVKELSTEYAPEIALSHEGHRLFIADTEIQATRPQSEIRIYDTRNLELLQRSPKLPNRDMYTTGPAATQFIAANDGSYVYLPKTELRNGRYVHTYITFDVRNNIFLPDILELPERAAIVTTLAGRSDLLFDFDGAEMEAVAWVDPVKRHAFDTVFTFDHPFERGMEFMITQLGASPDGNLGYVLTRNGRLRVIDLRADKVMPEMKLNLPEGAATPMGDLIVTTDYLVVPVATKDIASVGIAQSLCVFDRWSLKCLRTIDLSPGGNRVLLSADGTKLYVLSFRDHSIVTYDFASGAPLTRIDDVGETPIWFLAAPVPN